MTDLLTSIKADMVEKRLWLVIVVLLVAMVAAVVLIGGGSSSVGPLPPGATAGVSPPGPAITTAGTNPNLAVSETTTGARFQRQGGAHDPFFALVSPPPARTQTTTKGSGGSSPRASTPGTGTGTGAPITSPPISIPTPSTPPPTSTPTIPTPVGGTPAKPTPKYRVDFLFGQVPSNTTDPPTPDQLGSMQDFSDPPLGTLLPDSNTAVLAYSAVRDNGQSLTFTIKKESIPQGQGTCRPDPTNCRFVDVKPGQYETFDYQQPGGALVRYAVEVRIIAKA